MHVYTQKFIKFDRCTQIQYSICGKTSGGIGNVFLMYFWLNQWGVKKNLGVKRYQKGVEPPNNNKRALLKFHFTIYIIVPSSVRGPLNCI